MIITSITGGLGNQLFQYALAKSLSIKNNSDTIYLDYSWFNKKMPGVLIRRLELDKFNLFDGVKKIKYPLTARATRVGLGIISLLSKKKYTRHDEERIFIFDKDLINNKYDNLFINGYWQSHKYFDAIKYNLHNDIKIKDNLLSQDDKKYIEKAKLTNSVSLHIRRGDYSNTSLDNITLGYYYNAISYIKNKTNQPICLFIFSDDQEWAKRNLIIDCAHYHIDHNNEEKSANDLTIMSQCKHSIIANSTFSWWGAYLGCMNNISPNRVVIAPTNWWNGINHNAIDVYPDHWVKLDN